MQAKAPMMSTVLRGLVVSFMSSIPLRLEQQARVRQSHAGSRTVLNVDLGKAKVFSRGNRFQRSQEGGVVDRVDDQAGVPRPVLHAQVIDSKALALSLIHI